MILFIEGKTNLQNCENAFYSYTACYTCEFTQVYLSFLLELFIRYKKNKKNRKMFPCSRTKQESTTTISAPVRTASEIIPLFVFVQEKCKLIHPAVNKPFMNNFSFCFVRFVFKLE